MMSRTRIPKVDGPAIITKRLNVSVIVRGKYCDPLCHWNKQDICTYFRCCSRVHYGTRVERLPQCISKFGIADGSFTP